MWLWDYLAIQCVPQQEIVHNAANLEQHTKHIAMGEPLPGIEFSIFGGIEFVEIYHIQIVHT